MADTPKIFVFCNTKDCQVGAADWHSMIAIAEDGTFLAGHICSHHAFAEHDMGIVEGGRKRDLYAAHYPQGFEVVWVEDATNSKELDAAYEKNQAKAKQAAGG